MRIVADPVSARVYLGMFCRRPAVWGALLVLALLADCAHAGFYRWTDEHGAVHFTDNRANIPPQFQPDPQDDGEEHMPQAEEDGAARLPDAPRRVVVNYQKRGRAIYVSAVVNWKYPVLFHLDTGATSSMITESDARMLGLATHGGPTVKGHIADGSVVELPLVRLASIQVGEAEVQGLEATVGNVRLLGMDFLREFELSINAEAGQLVLTEKDAASSGSAPKREAESDVVRQEKEQTKRDLESQISRLQIAIKTKRDLTAQYKADIRDAESKRRNASSIVNGAQRRRRFERSGVSRDDDARKSIGEIENQMQNIDQYIENRKNNIAMLQEQITLLERRIAHCRTMLLRID